MTAPAERDWQEADAHANPDHIADVEDTVDATDSSDMEKTLAMFRRRHPLTDTGNALRLADDHYDRIRYAWGRGWLIWTGTHWRPDDTDELIELAKASARRTLWEVSEIRAGRTQLTAPLTADDNELADFPEKRADKHARFALRSQGARPLSDAIKLARSDPRLSIRTNQLDTDASLLNTPDGTIDLRTGELRMHNPADLISCITGARYVPGARSQLFDQFLDDLTGGDTELATWLQRAAGYSLSGHTSEEIFIFLHGPAASGKTTLLEAMTAAAGDYAVHASFETFLTGRNDGSSASPDIARLNGKRIVTASEVAGGKSFNTARLKSVTGGEAVVARQLYRDPIEFTPQLTLWFAGNDKPAAAADDDGFYRRLRLVPTSAVPETRRNAALKHKLTTDPLELAAILAWMIEGAVDWARNGLGNAEKVTAASAAYRLDNDQLADWITTSCQLNPDAQSSAQHLYDHYVTRTRGAGEEPLAQKDFKRALLAKPGIKRVRRNAGFAYTGIGLASAPVPPVHPVYPVHRSTGSPSYARARGDFSSNGAQGTQGALGALEVLADGQP